MNHLDISDVLDLAIDIQSNFTDTTLMTESLFAISEILLTALKEVDPKNPVLLGCTLALGMEKAKIPHLVERANATAVSISQSLEAERNAKQYE